MAHTHNNGQTQNDDPTIPTKDDIPTTFDVKDAFLEGVKHRIYHTNDYIRFSKAFDLWMEQEAQKGSYTPPF